MLPEEDGEWEPMSSIAAILEILDQVLSLIIKATDHVQKLEKEYEQKRQDLLAALASGDVDKLNQLINEL